MADITQPLNAVRKMAKSGYRVISDEQGSGALNKRTKPWIPIGEEEDAWFLDLWLNTDDQMKDHRTRFFSGRNEAR